MQPGGKREERRGEKEGGEKRWGEEIERGEETRSSIRKRRRREEKGEVSSTPSIIFSMRRSTYK